MKKNQPSSLLHSLELQVWYIFPQFADLLSDGILIIKANPLLFCDFKKQKDMGKICF